MWSIQSLFSRTGLDKTFGREDQLLHVVKRYMGRKSGSRAIEFARRAPSKKQLKRRAKLMIRLGQKRDPKKEAIQDKKVLRQLDNPKLGDELKNMIEQMRPEVLELSKPNPNFVYPQLDAPADPLPEFSIDGIEMLEHFEKFGKLQQGFKDTRIEEENAAPALTLTARMGKELVTSVNGTSLTANDLEREANNYVQHKIQHFFRTMNNWFPRKEVPPEYSAVYKIFYNLQKYNLRIDMESYCNIIRFQSFYGRYQSADQYFDEAIALCPADDVHNTMNLWSAKIENLGRSGQITEAIATLDRLQKMFQTTNPVLYNPFLRVLVDGKHIAESDEFWMRMHTDGVDLDVESFNIYLKGLAFRGEVERAFFVFREMVVCNVVPNTESFCMLLHACSRGPWWVKGYEDMVYDALDLIEASEFAPNRKIYNAIINVFAQSGDAMAAEYYFWEMRRKGIRPDSTTYTVLLEAYSRAQSVGVKYGFKGRYSPPPPKPLSEDELAMREVGPKRTAAIFAAGIHAEPVQPGRGTKNEKKLVKVVDLYDDEEAREAGMERIRLEAAELREKRRSVVAKHLFQQSSEQSPEQSTNGTAATLDSDFSSSLEEGVACENEKVRITFDDPKLLQEALSKAGDKLDNIRIQGLIRNEEDNGEETGDEEDMDDDPVANENKRLLEKADDFLDENLPTSQYRRQQELHRRVWKKLKGFTFTDPFKEEKGLKGQLWAEHRKRIRILKNKQLKQSDSGQGVDLENDVETSDLVALLDKEAEEAGRVDQQVSILSALDKKEDVGKDLDMMKKEIDKEWDFRSFGRAPPQDYEIGLVHKQNIIKSRAMLAFENMIENRIEPNVSHWNRLLAVHSEAMRTDEALIVFRNIKKNKELVDPKTYEYMIRMYVRVGDMDNAVMMKDEAIAGGLIPTEESFGLLMRGFTHRGKIVEALKILEESRSKGVAIRERNVKHLRSRCQTLGVSHPDLPPDPNAWVKSLKNERRNVKQSHQRRIQPLLSKFH